MPVRHECGVFGIYGDSPEVEAASLTYLGLYALQHRGQESAGMAVSDGRTVRLHKGMGLVPAVFDEDMLRRLPGHISIGHVRYSTTGASLIVNAQPLLVYSSQGLLGLAHNGNLVNAGELRSELMSRGMVFQSTSDSEVILNLIAHHSSDDLVTALSRSVGRIRGACAMVVIARDCLIGYRDPAGIRPLCLGRTKDAYVLASETCALSSLGGKLLRHVEPGEAVVIGRDGVRFQRLLPAKGPSFCIFEYVYFARPDSDIDGRNVHLVRKEIGRQLALEHPVDADMVIAAPDSGTSAAMGFSEASGIPFEVGIIKNRYIGRTFIQPSESMRDLGVRIKLNPIEKVLSGNRVVIVDDSIVRGTTSGKTIGMLRDAGATEVHMRVASPPYLHPCYYGIDTAARGELIASLHTVEEIRGIIGADSLGYLSHEGLVRAVGAPPSELCGACFSGRYPADVPCEAARGKHAFDV